MARRSLLPNFGMRRTTVLWLIFTIFSGGSVGGFLNPQLPVMGPIVKTILVALLGNSGIDPSILGQLQNATNPNGQNFPSSQYPFPSAQNPFPPAQYPFPPGQNAFPPVQNAFPPVQNTATVGPTAAQVATSQKPNDKLLIASFNIQVFGTSKLAKPQVMAVIVQILRQFDIIAIQEVRAQSDDILPTLIDQINANGSKYSFVIGPRLGRTVSTEQYAFVYDTSRVEYDPSSIGTVGDPNDLLHREPFVARFRPRTNSPNQAFTFWLVDIHTDPDLVPQEVDALAGVFQMMRTLRADEDDVILLGDLNASEAQLGRLGQIPGIRWVVSGQMTNTRQDKAYDNILFDAAATSEYTGRWGVFDFQKAFGLTRDQALQVSDHFPIWAEFGIWESTAPGQFASRAMATPR